MAILTVEWCPHCENEVEIPEDRPSPCPSCRVLILPCADCWMAFEAKCDWTAERRCSQFPLKPNPLVMVYVYHDRRQASRQAAILPLDQAIELIGSYDSLDHATVTMVDQETPRIGKAIDPPTPQEIKEADWNRARGL